MSDVEADRVETAPPETEPVRVARLTAVQERAGEAYEALCREFGADGEQRLTCSDDAALDAFACQVALRVADMRRDGVADALLVAMLIERLCGVSDKPVVKVPRKLLNRRIAMAGR